MGPGRSHRSPLGKAVWHDTRLHLPPSAPTRWRNTLTGESLTAQPAHASIPPTLRLTDLLAEHLPLVRMRPLEATYLAWLDVRAYGHDDPAGLAMERGRVWVGQGRDYAPDLGGHVRLNIATSPQRLEEIVRRLARAWTAA